MNVERNLPADTVVAGCTATIQDTMKNLATGHYLRALALRSKRDFDGATTTPFDATGLAQVTQALLDAGMAPADIGKVMGGNVLRLLRETLPAR